MPPDTLILLSNGNTIPIKDVCTGDILLGLYSFVKVISTHTVGNISKLPVKLPRKQPKYTISQEGCKRFGFKISPMGLHTCINIGIESKENFLLSDFTVVGSSYV